MQEKYGVINLEEVKTIENDLWQLSICVNAQSRTFHTEADSVPTQKNHQVRYRFLFEINKYNNLALKMIPALYFLFSAKLLTDRQASSQSDPV